MAVHIYPKVIFAIELVDISLWNKCLESQQPFLIQFLRLLPYWQLTPYLYNPRTVQAVAWTGV